MAEFDKNRQQGDAQAEGQQAGNEERAATADFTTRPLDVEETDLSGMDPQAAREYVLAYIRTLKETQLQITKLKEEAAVWQNRVQLAAQQNRLDLKAAAETKKNELESRLTALMREEQDLLAKITVLKENLKKLQGKFQYSIDAEQLLATLEMIVGERDTLKDKFKEADAQAELERIKARLQQEQEGKG